MTGELGRLGTVAWLSFRGSMNGARALGLAAFAAMPTVIVAAIASAHPAASAGVPKRPNGIALAIAPRSSGRIHLEGIIASLSVVSGAIALTRMPS